MRIELPFLGKTKKSYIEDGINDFVHRLSYYVPVEIKLIKVKSLKGRTDEQVRENDSILLDNSVAPGNFRVVLDSRGILISSEELAELITKLEHQNVKQVSFIIGGPLGLAEEQIKHADRVISLSKMTFTHDMTRLILLEQLYRAFTIKSGEQYHK